MATVVLAPDPEARQFARSCLLVAVTPLALLAPVCVLDLVQVRWPATAQVAQVATIALLAVSPFLFVWWHWRWQLPTRSSLARAVVTGALATFFGLLLALTVESWFHAWIGGPL